VSFRNIQNILDEKILVGRQTTNPEGGRPLCQLCAFYYSVNLQLLSISGVSVNIRNWINSLS
jgi:hypothetical protein